MAQGRKKQNIRLENAIDTDDIDDATAAIEKIDAERKNSTDKDKLAKLAKARARRNYRIRRLETRIANRIAGPKTEIDLEDLL